MAHALVSCRVETHLDAWQVRVKNFLAVAEPPGVSGDDESYGHLVRNAVDLKKIRWFIEKQPGVEKVSTRHARVRAPRKTGSLFEEPQPEILRAFAVGVA